MICQICSSITSVVPELYALPSITSDCRKWDSGRSVQICSGCGVLKRNFGSEFSTDIYRDYISYPEPSGRTEKILKFVKDKIPEPKTILDVGTGEGSGLFVLSQQFPSSMILGYEPNGDKFTTRPESKFDLITLFHVLEHVEDLNGMLEYIKSSLSKNGTLLIQIPLHYLWPFDLVIADHIWHFTMGSLTTLLDKAGFGVVYIGAHAILKELTVVANIGKTLNPTCIEESPVTAINWLLNYKKYLDAIDEPICVYGTGPAAAWTGNILGDKVISYLDDDVNRQQKIFNSKRVEAPFQCDFPIVAPFPDWQIGVIKKQNPSLRFL